MAPRSASQELGRVSRRRLLLLLAACSLAATVLTLTTSGQGRPKQMRFYQQQQEERQQQWWQWQQLKQRQELAQEREEKQQQQQQEQQQQEQQQQQQQEQQQRKERQQQQEQQHQQQQQQQKRPEKGNESQRKQHLTKNEEEQQQDQRKQKHTSSDQAGVNLGSHIGSRPTNNTANSVGIQSSKSSAVNIIKPPLYPAGFRLSNLTNFTFVINNDVCGSEPVDLVMIVISDTRLPSRRDALRDTLPSHVLSELRIRRVFLVAELTPPPNISAEYDLRVAALQTENHEHADLVAGSFFDSYHNLTYKHLMGLHWAAAYCPQARHIVKHDQDITLDIFRLHEHLQTAPLRRAIIGTEYAGTGPIRDPKNKWYVSREQFAPDQYPTYMSGSLYVITPDVAARLAAGSVTVPFFWVDDAFVTGILREAVAPDAAMLDFGRLWGRPDASGRTAGLFTLQSSCLFECAASRQAMLAQCDTLFGQANPLVLRMFMKQAEYCYRRRPNCARRSRMPDSCHGGYRGPAKRGIPYLPQQVWDVN